MQSIHVLLLYYFPLPLGICPQRLSSNSQVSTCTFGLAYEKKWMNDPHVEKNICDIALYKMRILKKHNQLAICSFFANKVWWLLGLGERDLLDCFLTDN